MLAKLQRAQTESPEALSAALDYCNKTLGLQNRDKTTPPMTTAAQLRFVEDGGAEFCLALIQNSNAARAWETLWYASRPAKTQTRLFGVPGLVQAAVQEMQQGPSAVAATYLLSNLAYGAQTGVALAQHPGLLQAAVQALVGPTKQAALALLANLASLDANKMALAQTPGLFAAVDQVVIGRDTSGRGRYILEQLQQLRVMSMVTVPLVLTTDGAPAPETMSPDQAQMMTMMQQMMQQQMAQQQLMFQQQMAMQQAQMQVHVQGQKQAHADTSCLTKLVGCLVCFDCVSCCCCC